MTNKQQDNNLFDRFTKWTRQSIMLKLITITILMLLLLIPTSMVESIISERSRLNRDTTREVSDKWAKNQRITGPVLSIPLSCVSRDGEEVVHFTRYWHILPESLDVGGTVQPEELERGIYKIVVYDSQLSFKGEFSFPEAPSGEDIQSIRYDEAFLTIGITDLRGIREDLDVSWSGTPLSVSPGSRVPGITETGISVKLPPLDTSGVYSFSFSLGLHGSGSLRFTPVGSQTNVHLTSSWPSPSFNGNFLPDSRIVNEGGFTADWKVLELNRNYPQTWVADEYSQHLPSSDFGVDLLLTLDDYQKSTRSVKYGIMTIALTFLVFFLVEVMNNRKIHPFQYVLVGLGLCLFYVLLVSISEHTDFNMAYGISTAAVVSMITLYSTSIFKSPRLVLLLLVTLLGTYGFLFVNLQLVDYALLLGSIGLFIILAITMYLTRHIDWYRFHSEEQPTPTS